PGRVARRELPQAAGWGRLVCRPRGGAAGGDLDVDPADHAVANHRHHRGRSAEGTCVARLDRGTGFAGGAGVHFAAARGCSDLHRSCRRFPADTRGALTEPRSNEMTDPDRTHPDGTFDIQVNGYAGVDFNGDDLNEEELHRACAALRADGVSGILATIITDKPARMIGRLKRLIALRGADNLARDVIAGLHIEGPFLSDEPGYRGAHPAD